MGKKVGLVGYGDIGKCTAERLKPFGVDITVYDPAFKGAKLDGVRSENWPDALGEQDFLIFTCSLTEKSYQMFDMATMSLCKNGVSVVNVARGQLIHESALIDCLKSGKVLSAALDVFESEPISPESFLCNHESCILGSHNGSNTTEAVMRANQRVTKIMMEFLFEDTK